MIAQREERQQQKQPGPMTHATAVADKAHPGYSPLLTPKRCPRIGFQYCKVLPQSRFRGWGLKIFCVCLFFMHFRCPNEWFPITKFRPACFCRRPCRFGIDPIMKRSAVTFADLGAYKKDEKKSALNAYTEDDLWVNVTKLSKQRIHDTMRSLSNLISRRGKKLERNWR